MKKLTAAQVKTFRTKVYRHCARQGRDFTFRHAKNPYEVFVSEVMLQQTQTARVNIKFPQFIAAFPSFKALADATLADVLKEWQGMGYNRRALFLQKAARMVVDRYNGSLPREISELEQLPGIGPATARSIAAYAYNQPTVFIETNIRAVYIHDFFPGKDRVHDDDLLPLVTQTLDANHASRWYNALMDYGVMLKEQHKNPARRSRHHVQQKKFEGSDRQIRGAILRALTAHGPQTAKALTKHTTPDQPRLMNCLETLIKDTLIIKTGKKYRIA